MTLCVTKATPIHFIDSKTLKGCRAGLTNHTGSISFMSMVINVPRVDTHTHMHTDMQTKAMSITKLVTADFEVTD